MFKNNINEISAFVVNYHIIGAKIFKSGNWRGLLTIQHCTNAPR
jgi:hypothetical protein